jgi:hypothetical protein
MLPIHQTPPLPSSVARPGYSSAAASLWFAALDRVSARQSALGRLKLAVGTRLAMRWFARVLARLAIAATCTSSAAALDAHNERSKYSSSASSLWEHSCRIHLYR